MGKDDDFYLDDIIDELDNLDKDAEVDYYINDPCDVDEPQCAFCGSTTWEYCRLGEGNIISECSDCPVARGRH